MHLESSRHARPEFGSGIRSGDRRACKQIQPPPYATAEGVVTVDRRSHVDRRAAWVREFSLELGSEA